MTTQLTELAFDGVDVTKTHDGVEKHVSGVSVSRWNPDDGPDRLYINGLFTSTTDVYVDLVEESVTVSGTKTRTSSCEFDGDELTVTIKRPSWNYIIRVGVVDDDNSPNATDSDESDDETNEDLENSLKDLGVTI